MSINKSDLDKLINGCFSGKSKSANGINMSDFVPLFSKFSTINEVDKFDTLVSRKEYEDYGKELLIKYKLYDISEPSYRPEPPKPAHAPSYKQEPPKPAPAPSYKQEPPKPAPAPSYKPESPKPSYKPESPKPSYKQEPPKPVPPKQNKKYLDYNEFIKSVKTLPINEIRSEVINYVKTINDDVFDFITNRYPDEKPFTFSFLHKDETDEFKQIAIRIYIYGDLDLTSQQILEFWNLDRPMYIKTMSAPSWMSYSRKKSFNELLLLSHEKTKIPSILRFLESERRRKYKPEIKKDTCRSILERYNIKDLPSWKKWVILNHPDKFNNESPEIIKEKTATFILVSTAWKECNKEA